MAELSTLLEAIRERSEALSSLGHILRFDLTDSGESILLDASSSDISVAEGTGEADAVLKLSSDTLDKLIKGRIGPMMAFSTGRLKVEGSTGVALKLASLLDGE